VADDFWAHHLQADYENELRSGWGAESDADLQRMADEIAEANRVAAMDMSAWAAERRRLGLSRDLVQFLGGN
jgi:hypothetical protein